MYITIINFNPTKIMKKFLAALLLLTSVLSGYSQDEGNLKNQFYFRFGYSNPTWKYMGADGKDDWGGAKKMGGLFEFGNIFMLNSIKIAPGLRLGINVDYLSLGYHQASSFDDYTDMDKIYFFYAGSKIGPSISYSPVKNLVIDTYFKLNPEWVSVSDWTYTDDSDDELYMGFVGLKYSVGINVRYSILMMGFEFNPGALKMKWYDTENNELSDEYMGNMNSDSDKTPVPAMNFTLGLSF
jgi:hypothetical protein